MIRIFKLVVLLVISQVAFGQAPSNYTNINGRYRWIAGMFDSTFHIPKGSTPSLRTGGSTNSGGLFYRTSDSSVYTYTGTQWIKLRGSINPSDTTNKYVTQVYKKSGSDSIFYVKGGTHTWAFNDSTGSPGGGGGGKVYYFNGGVNMGTIGGLQMYELGDTANTGAAANFTRSTTGNIANFITDPGKPGLLQIPAGVWSVDAWLSETGGGANHAEIWIEVEKWDGSTITTIATSPIEQITEGATPNLYSWSVSIPTTSLTVTDRIIIQFYISNTNGKTVTLYTQNGYVGEVHTTFTTGIGAINGLTTPAQYLVTGTSGVDFNISSATATHTFNLPTASSMIRGALSPTDWSAFNNKIGPSDTASMLSPYFRLAGIGLKNTGQTVYADTLLLSTRAWRQKGVDSVASLINTRISGTTNYIPKFTSSSAIGNSIMYEGSSNIGINTSSPTYKLDIKGGNASTLRLDNDNSQYVQLIFERNTTANSGADFLLDGTNGTFGIRTLATYPIVFSTSASAGNPTERMRLDASGNLGLGTSNPSFKLDVNSGASNAYARIQTTGSANWATLLLQNGDGTWYNTNNSDGNFNIGTGADPSDNIKLTLTSSGNLGLSVTPSAWASGWKALQIGKTTSIADNDFGDVYLLANAYYDGSSTRYIATGFNATYYGQENGAHIWYTAPSGTAGNAISFTQAMTLDASGRLGIGVTNPSVKLNVGYTSDNRGIIQINSNAANRMAAVTFYGNNAESATIGYEGGSEIVSGGVQGDFIIRNNLNKNIILTGGNVGIGTTSPAVKLQVENNGAAVYSNAGFTNTSSTAALYMGVGGSSVAATFLQNNAYLINSGNSALIFGTNDTERMRITSGGELLINTTTDAGDYKLQVNGNISSSQGLYFTANTSQTAGSISRNATYGLTLFGIAGSTYDIGLVNKDGSDVMKVPTGTGNVEFAGSIKTAAPSGGTAKPWKLGEAGVSVGGANTTAVKVEIDGVVYYLLTAYLPEPAPESAPKPKPEG